MKSYRQTAITVTLWTVLWFARPIAGQEIQTTFAGIDVYGTDRFTAAAVQSAFGEDFEQLVELYTANDFDGLRGLFDSLYGWVETSGAYEFTDVGLHMDFVPPDSLQLRVTIDVVEPTDRARRMPFRDEPAGTYADPDGLFGTWQEYETQGSALALSGALQGYECPVLHCLYSFEHPDLAPYLADFNGSARQHRELLLEILKNDRDASHRSKAVLLLAHALEPGELLPILAEAMHDASGDVRNNAMRVMVFMAQADPNRSYPVDELIAALDFPTASDRNKSAFTLLNLADAPRHRDTIRAAAVPYLLQLLRTEGRSTHDPAYELLLKLSGQDYGSRDYAAWENWASASVQ